MRGIVNTTLISAVMAVIGLMLIQTFLPDIKNILSNPGILAIVIVISVGLWLRAAIGNRGDLKSFIIIILFGFVSPLVVALFSGLAIGFIGGAIGAWIIVIQAWYITFPIGLLTGLFVFAFTRPKK